MEIVRDEARNVRDERSDADRTEMREEYKRFEKNNCWKELVVETTGKKKKEK